MQVAPAEGVRTGYFPFFYQPFGSVAHVSFLCTGADFRTVLTLRVTFLLFGLAFGDPAGGLLFSEKRSKSVY